MDIKSLLPKKEDKEEKYFWALIIEPGLVQAGIWTLGADSAEVVTYSNSVHWELDEELISATDAVLSQAVQTFPEDFQAPVKTVFSLIGSWVSGGEIKPEYLDKIKKLCSELSLEPVGFVVLPEAIAHFYKSEEGSPLNSIVLGINKDNLELTIFKLGNLSGSSKIARSVSIVDDVTEGLTRFSTGEPLPPRFILYDGKGSDLEDAKQELIKANWEDYDNIKFLHFPKVEALNEDKKIMAVCLAGASEIAGIKKVSLNKDFREETTENLSPDVVQNIEEPLESVAPEEFGFSVNEDISQKKDLDEVPKEQIVEDMAPQTEVHTEVQVKQEVVPQAKIKKPPLKFGALIFAFPGKIRAKLAGFLKRFRLFSGISTQLKKIMSAGVFTFLFIIAFGIAFWWFYPKASITIFLASKRQDNKVEATIDPKVTTADYEKEILPGTIIKTTVSGDKTKQTTGTKTVGDQAKGEVTLYRVGTQLNLTSGTVLHGPSSLDFTLDGDAAIASGSASTPGTTKVNVTAKNIGAQYNLASGTSFSVSNYSTSDIEAKNESSFSGGSSRDINAVSDDDQKNLLSDLQKELEDKAKSEIAAKVSDQQVLINESIKSAVSLKNFSAKVGDEASNLKLDLTLDSSGVAVDESALKQLSLESFKNSVPQGYSLNEDQIEYDFNFKSEDTKDGPYHIEVFMKANLLPQVDVDKIKKDILGRYPSVAEEYFIKQVPSFSRAEIRFNKPRLPGRLGTLPRVSKHLEIIISGEK